MDRQDKIPVKMFDGQQFSIWKYHMKIIFEAKKVLQVVHGLEKRPLSLSSEISAGEQLAMETGDEKNAKARMFISKSISQKILRKLTTCSITATMWQKLSSLHLLKTLESIFPLQDKFFDYKMQIAYDISTHI
nr:hypothetical protein PHYPA_000619 [Physcomitrium patens]